MSAEKLVDFINDRFGLFVAIFIISIGGITAFVQFSTGPGEVEERKNKMQMVSALIGVISICFALLGVFKAPEAAFSRMIPKIKNELEDTLRTLRLFRDYTLAKTEKTGKNLISELDNMIEEKMNHMRGGVLGRSIAGPG